MSEAEFRVALAAMAAELAKDIEAGRWGQARFKTAVLKRGIDLLDEADSRAKSLPTLYRMTLIGG